MTSVWTSEAAHLRPTAWPIRGSEEAMCRRLETRPASRLGRPALTAWLYAGTFTAASACAGAPIGTAPAESTLSPPLTSAVPVATAQAPSETVPDRIPSDERIHFRALELDARGALQAFSNRNARWSPSRRSVVFLSNREGEFKAFLSDWQSLGLPPRPVHGPPGPILDASFHPNGRALFLLASKGEDTTLHLADIGRGTCAPWGPPGVRWLSSPQRPLLARGPIALFADAPRRVLFGTPDDPSRHSVTLTTGQEPMALGSVGKHVLLVERGEGADGLVELDRNGTRRVWVEPSSGHAIDAATYGRDGRSVVFAVRSAGQTKVMRVGKPGRPATLVFEPADGTQVVTLAGSPRSPNLAALTRSPQGMEVVLVSSTGYRRQRPVRLPVGVGQLGAFSRDGKVLTLTWETPDSPSDIYEIATDTGRLRRLRSDVRPALARLENLRLRRETVTVGQGALELSVFEPMGGTKHPAVLLLGQPGPHAPAWRPELRFLVGKGLVVLEPWTPYGQAPQLDALQLQAWLQALDTWLPSQSWWAKGRKAVIVRESMHQQMLGAIHDGAPAWPTVLAPPPDVTLPDGPLPEAWRVMLSVQAPCPRWAETLRARGAHVEYAVSSAESERLAREVLFLERGFR